MYLDTFFDYFIFYLQPLYHSDVINSSSLFCKGLVTVLKTKEFFVLLRWLILLLYSAVNFAALQLQVENEAEPRAYIRWTEKRTIFIGEIFTSKRQRGYGKKIL